MAARKKQLRSELRSRRRELYSGAEGARRRARESELLREHAAPAIERILSVRATQGAAAPRVAAYHPSPLEADVMPVVRHLLELGAELVFPAAAENGQLEWVLWDGRSPFVDSPGRGFGKEPLGRRLGPEALAQAAAVLAPAVAVDRSGTRIGHGGGYYDRALTHVPPTAEIVAVVHPVELLAAGSLPRGPHDVTIPSVLTADGLVCLVTIDGSAAPKSPQRP